METESKKKVSKIFLLKWELQIQLYAEDDKTENFWKIHQRFVSVRTLQLITANEQ